MSGNLSASKYIKNNKRTCGVLLFALSLTFMAMYIVNYLLMTTQESFVCVMLELPKKVSYVSLTSDTLLKAAGEETKDTSKQREILMEELKQREGIKDVIFTQIIDSTYEGIIGQIGYECPLFEKEYIQTFLDHMDAELVEGKMPENDGDVLVDSTVMKNQKYKIGDTFRKEAYGDTFKICGVIKSDCMACVGVPNGFTNSGWYMVIMHDESESLFASAAKDLGITLSDRDEVIDAKTYQDFYDREVKDTINGAVNAIIIVVMIFLAVSVIVAYVSFLRNRLTEYCLYTSIGYSKKDIYEMIMREMMIIFISGIAIGVVISIIIMGISDACVIAPKGLMSRWFYPMHIAKIFAALCCIAGALQIPILVSIHNIKTMDMMEER